MADQFVRAANVDEVPPGKMKCVRLAGRAILLANVDGNFYATDDTCTHEDASLSSGSLKGELVKCPLHNSRFNVRTGEVIEEPARADLKTYPVKIAGRDILIAIDK
jgi:nitrite reductase/ring-hydroxylating ferredoxin subunit